MAAFYHTFRTFWTTPHSSASVQAPNKFGSPSPLRAKLFGVIRLFRRHVSSGPGPGGCIFSHFLNVSDTSSVRAPHRPVLLGSRCFSKIIQHWSSFSTSCQLGPRTWRHIRSRFSNVWWSVAALRQTVRLFSSFSTSRQLGPRTRWLHFLTRTTFRTFWTRSSPSVQPAPKFGSSPSQLHKKKFDIIRLFFDVTSARAQDLVAAFFHTFRTFWTPRPSGPHTSLQPGSCPCFAQIIQRWSSFSTSHQLGPRTWWLLSLTLFERFGPPVRAPN